MTDSPSVTCPSPARTTLPLRRMDRTVVERIRRFWGMRVILDYSSVDKLRLGVIVASASRAVRSRGYFVVECAFGLKAAAPPRGFFSVGRDSFCLASLARRNDNSCFVVSGEKCQEGGDGWFWGRWFRTFVK